MKRTPRPLFGLAGLLLVGCVGTIGSAEKATDQTGGAETTGGSGNEGGAGNEGGTGNTPPPPGFACSQDSIVASQMRRLSKAQYIGSLREFLSTFSATARDQLLAAVAAPLESIPGDG